MAFFKEEKNILAIHNKEIVLNIENIELMLAFYTDIIGMKPERVQEFRTGQVPFPSVRINPDTIIDLFPKSMSPNQINKKNNFNRLNHFCLSFDKKEWDRLRQRIEAHDISIEEGPVERWGAHGEGISIYISDPENNKIEIRYYSDPSGL